MLRTVLAAGLVTLGTYAAAQDPETVGPEPMRIEGMAPWGTISRVMEPEYPKELIEGKAKVHVDISGRVTYYGELVDVIYTPGSDAAKLMVEPLRSVMRHWTFRTPTDNDCQPTGVVVKNRVEFDFEGERPKLSVFHADLKKAYAGPTIKVVTRTNPVFPRDMQRRGWQSFVYTRLTIDPQGNVTDVLATAYPRQEGIDLSDFEKESIRALRKWTFNPMPDLQRPRHACYEVYYRLKG